MRQITAAFTCVLAIALATTVAAKPASPPAPFPASHASDDVSTQKLAWAQYMGWNVALDSSLSIYNYYNYPLLHSTGISRDDWRNEYRLAKAQGIDGFFVDVVMSRKGNPPAFVSVVRDMLKAAEGTDFKIALSIDVKTTVEYQVREISKMLDQFGQHPNYPRYQGRPIVVAYTWAKWTPDEWKQIRAGLHKNGHDIYLIATSLKPAQVADYLPCLDMAYSFGFFGIDGVPRRQTADGVADPVTRAGKDYMATMNPGYYGAWLNGRNGFYTPFRGFDLFHDCFDLIRKGRDKWINYTSWNDYDETSILPMLFTTANPVITRSYTDWFKDIPPSAHTPQVNFAYHREELAGTLLRLEALSLPTALDADDRIIVKGRLLDAGGNPVATLPEKTFPTRDYARAEWLIPTHTLADTPVLIPEISTGTRNTGYTHTAKLPPTLLINGWPQNNVTVKVPVNEYTDFPETLRLATADTGAATPGAHVLTATIDYDSPADLRTIILFRNDRPVALFDPQTEGRTLLHLYIKGGADYTLHLDDPGEIIQAVRKSTEKTSPYFTWGKTSVRSALAQPWAPSGITVAVTPGTRLTIETPGQPPLELTAAMLLQRYRFTLGKLVVEASPADVTLQNQPFLPPGERKAVHTVSLLTREPHINDLFYVRYETTDGHTHMSAPVYPFAPKNALVPANIVRSSVTFETTSGAMGMPGEWEYLTPPSGVPFRTPALIATRIPLQSIRAGRWTFDGNGRDTLGDMPVVVPENLFADATPAKPGFTGANDKVLDFDGKKAPLTMRLHTWPLGGTTVDFLLNPAAGAAARQSVIGTVGWCDAININLLPDGRVEVIRNGNDTVLKETAVSTGKLPFGQWTRLRVTNDGARIRIYINDALDSETPVTPARSYGNSTWYVGGGFKNCENFRGQIDDLTVLGAAFAPGDPACPFFQAGRP